MRKLGWTGGTNFCVEASKYFRHAAAILDWAKDKCDQPILESDTQRVTAKENWERLNHECDRSNPLRNIQLLERLLPPTHVGYSDMVVSMERLEQELRVVRQRFGDDVHGSGATPMDVDALAKTKGGRKSGKGKDEEFETKKFDGHCYRCGAYGHVMKDCREKAAGKTKNKGKGKRCQGKKGASSLNVWPDGREEQLSGEKSSEEVAGLFVGAVDRRAKYDKREKYKQHEKYSQREWQAWSGS